MSKKWHDDFLVCEILILQLFQIIIVKLFSSKHRIARKVRINKKFQQQKK